MDALVWFTLALYVALRVVAHALEEAPEQIAYFETSGISIIGGFLSFFLVMFVDQVNARFLEMYGFSMAVSRKIQDVALRAHEVLPVEYATRLVRRLNAAHVAGYVGLNSIGCVVGSGSAVDCLLLCAEIEPSLTSRACRSSPPVWDPRTARPNSSTCTARSTTS